MGPAALTAAASPGCFIVLFYRRRGDVCGRDTYRTTAGVGGKQRKFKKSFRDEVSYGWTVLEEQRGHELLPLPPVSGHEER